MKFNRDASEAVAGFSIEHYDVIPDGIVLGKSAGGGFPLDAFMAQQEIMRSLPVSVCASTIAGFHLACAAGMAQFAYMCSARFWKIPDKNSHLMANFAEKLLSRKKETGVACIWDEETGSDDPFIAY